MIQEQDKIYKVYKHTLPMNVSGKVNDMVYIGITCRNKASDRWGKNGINYKYNTHFYRSIKKYGWDNFEHEVLFDGLTEDEANQKEIELIAYYNSTDNLFGYNVRSGGGGHGKLTEETKYKLSELRKGYKHSEETIRKIVENRRSYVGENNPRFGIPMSNETKAKISQKATGRMVSEETKKKLSEINSGEKNAMYGKTHTQEARDKIAKTHGHVIICVETGIVYPSEIEAKRQTGIENATIQRCCKGIAKYAGKLPDGTKLHWMYYEDYLKQQEQKVS